MDVDTVKLQNLYKKSEPARLLFDHFAKRTNDASETKVDRILSLMKGEGHDLSRGQVIDVFKELEKLECGRFVTGRHGWPSRFVWTVSLVGVGKVAGGENQQLKTKASGSSEDETPANLTHNFHLRPDMQIKLELPSDLTTAEALRLAEFIKALPFGEDEE